MTNKRINFRSGVPDILYKRAGGTCSVPRCKNPTMGPFCNDSEAVNLGVACHIYSAAKNGPRGYADKDPQFISSEKNGIWCCVHHAALIDKKNGKDYPAATLFAWKKLAEARTLKQMNDIPSPLGWISSIEFLKYENLKMPPKVDLSRRTFIFGRNCSGKSSLMEAAACISQSKYAERFRRSRIAPNLMEDTPDFKAKIIYSTVDTLSKEVTVEVTNGVPKRFDGGTQCLLPPGDISILYCSSYEQNHKYNEDDVDYLTRYLNIDQSSLIALLKNRNNSLFSGEIKLD